MIFEEEEEEEEEEDKECCLWPSFVPMLRNSNFAK
jgi:hypothetical protein